VVALAAIETRRTLPPRQLLSKPGIRVVWKYRPFT